MSNFTKTQTARMLNVYNKAVEDGADYKMRSQIVMDLAGEMKVTVPQARGKLVSEGVYIPKGETTTPNKASKEEVIKAMEDVFGVELPSYKNAALRDLNAMWDAFIKMSQSVNEELGVKE